MKTLSKHGNITLHRNKFMAVLSQWVVTFKYTQVYNLLSSQTVS